MAHDNVLRVQALWRGLENGNLDAMLSIADTDTVWMPAGPGGPRFRGHAGLRDFMADRDASGPVDARAYRFSAYGDNVLVFGSIRHRHDGRGEERRVFWVYAFRDGLLTQVEAFDDHHEAVRAAALSDLRPD